MSKERNKSIGVNFVYNAFYNTMKVLFPLITIPYISRVLLSDGLGKVNYAVNIATWFLMFASLGIPRYGVREIARNKNDSIRLNKTFSELFLINCISTTLCVCAYFLMLASFPAFKDKVLLYLVVGIQLVLNVFNVDWFYQGIEEYGYITKRSLVIKTISLLVMFCLVKTHEDYIIYAFIQSMAVAGNYLFNFLNLKKYVQFTREHIQLKKHMSAVFVLFSTQLSVSIYALLDTTMLGVWCSDSVIGYYSNVYKIISTISVLTASLGGVMLPRMMQMKEKNDISALEAITKRAQEIILVLCLPISLGLFLVSSDIVLVLFGKDFVMATTTVKIFAPFIVFSTVGNLYGTQLLMAFNKEKTLLCTVLIGSIINFSMNWFLIKLYQHNGAAFASVFTEMVVMIAQIVLVNKILKIREDFKFLAQTLIALFILLIVVVGIQHLISNIYLRLALSITLGGGVYFVFGYILKNTAIVEMYNFLISRLRKN